MALDLEQPLILDENVKVKTHSEMRQAILDKYAKTIANKNIDDLTPMERAKYDAADELAKEQRVDVPTLHFFNKERLKHEEPVTDQLRIKLTQALNNTPDFQDSIAMDQTSLSKIAKFLEATDCSQYNKLENDKTGHDKALLEIAKTVQAHGVRSKQKKINAIIDHRVENPIDKPKGFLRKAFAAVAGTFIITKPQMVFAKAVGKAIGKSAIFAGALMAAGTVDQDSGVAPISFPDIEHEISTVFTDDGIATQAETRLVEAKTVLLQIAADPSSVSPADAVKEAALAADALDDQILGKSSVGFEMVQDGVVEETEIVAEARPKLAYKIQEAATRAYFDTGLVPESNLDMAYLAFGAVKYRALDGLHRTDAVAIERGTKLAEADIPLSGPAQEIVTLVEEANAQGFTPLMVDSNQMLTQFSKNNPEIMAQIDSAETERTRGEMIMMAAYDIAEANGINMNQLTTGGVLMIPKQFDFSREYPLREIQSHNRTAGMPQYNR